MARSWPSGGEKCRWETGVVRFDRERSGVGVAGVAGAAGVVGGGIAFFVVLESWVELYLAKMVRRS